MKNLDLEKKLLEVTQAYLNDKDFVKDATFDKETLKQVLNLNITPPQRVSDFSRYVFSEEENQNLKTSKYLVSINNSRIEKNKEVIFNFREYSKNMLKSQGDLAKRIDSEIEELESKYFEKSDKVHVNNFSKANDKGEYSERSLFKKDFRSNLAFEKKNLMEGFFGIGLSLPIKSRERVSVDKCIVIDEETNVGDTQEKIFPNENPNHIFRKNKIFRHALVKRSSDTTSRFYKRETTQDSYPYNLIPTLTIEVNLESYSEINYLVIDPVSAEGFSLKSLTVFDGNIEVKLDFVTKTIENKHYVFFESIYGSKLKMSFEQRVCIENAKVIVSEKSKYYLNESLRKNGFISRVEENYEVITGYVYDLSLKDIEIGKVTFMSSGFFQSQLIEVFDFLSSRVDYSYIGNNEDIYVESYLGLSLLDKDGNLSVEELLPLPDYKTNQKEVLNFYNGESKCKLYPDVMNNVCISEIKFKSIGGRILDFVFLELEIDECFSPELVSQTNLNLKNVLEDGSIVFENEDFFGFIYRKAGGTNRWYAYVTNVCYDFNNYVQSDFFALLTASASKVYFREEFFIEVYEDQRLLEPGIDYEYSLNKGVDWFGNSVNQEEYSKSFLFKKAGDFKIRLKINELEKSVYSVIYKIAQKQILSKNNKVYLINEKIKLDESLLPNYGFCQNVFTVKNKFGNSSDFFLIEKYKNILFQNGQKEDTIVIKKKFGNKLKGSDL